MGPFVRNKNEVLKEHIEYMNMKDMNPKWVLFSENRDAVIADMAKFKYLSRKGTF